MKRRTGPSLGVYYHKRADKWEVRITETDGRCRSMYASDKAQAELMRRDIEEGLRKSEREGIKRAAVVDLDAVPKPDLVKIHVANREKWLELLAEGTALVKHSMERLAQGLVDSEEDKRIRRLLEAGNTMAAMVTAANKTISSGGLGSGGSALPDLSTLSTEDLKITLNQMKIETNNGNSDS
jgi:hypothetical protein